METFEDTLDDVSHNPVTQYNSMTNAATTANKWKIFRIIFDFRVLMIIQFYILRQHSLRVIVFVQVIVLRILEYNIFLNIWEGDTISANHHN